VTPGARAENAKTLGKLLGLDDEDAAGLLDMTIVVRAAPDAPSQAVRRHLVDLLIRTVGHVAEDAQGAVGAEILVGAVAPATWGPVVRVGVTAAEIVITCEKPVEHDPGASVPEILLLIGACYAAGMGTRLGIGQGFVLPYENTIHLPVDQLLRGGRDDLARPVQIGTVYLAGAGAIGNALLRALALVDVEGELHIVDPKRVTAGNLGRCLWFHEEDVGRGKAEALAARAQPRMPSVTLVPRAARVQDLPERSAGPWLRRLVVAVDSRRARRQLQEELPGEVFDASTTGIEEIVLHFNRAGSGAACLSCIYREDQIEAAHEQHVAAMLGVDLTDVREHYISNDAARRMANRHPQLEPACLVGTAYDSLFKSLCAIGELGVDEGRTVLAPFASVSGLAGAYLALELLLRAASDDMTRPFNYWRASPWTSPVFELRACRPARENCETCADALIRGAIEQLWGRSGKKAT
jgi:hypothetical protein